MTEAKTLTPGRPDALSRDLGKRELETIIMVSTLLNSTALKMERVLQLAMQAIAEAMDAEAGSIFLLDEERGELEIHVPTGDSSEQLQGLRIPKDHGIVGWVVTSGKPLLIEDAAQDERFTGKIDDETGFVTHSVLAVPMKVRGKVIGALEILNKRGGGTFKRSDVAFMGALANQVAIALENARLYAALTGTYEEVKRLDDLKSNFINVAAHELLTPITVLSAYVDLLESETSEAGEDGRTVTDAVLGVRNGLSRLTKLSHDLINMMLIDERRIQVDFAPVDVGEVLESVVREVGGFARRRRQELTHHLDPGAGDLFVHGDAARLKHVVHNLLMNAIRFTPDGGRVGVTAALQEHEVRVSVQDNGIGIPKSEHQRIFDKMYELSPVSSHSSGTYQFRSGGLGLGLSIAKGIVDAHSGRIWVESESGQGSTFTFALTHVDAADPRAGRDVPL